jgi:hypothetical protein
MKPRTVLVTLEIVTDAKLEKLRDKREWTSSHGYEWTVRQVTATVQQPPEEKK